MRAKAYSIGIRIFWHPRAQLLSSAPGPLIVSAVSACAADDHAHPAARNRPRLPAPQEPWAYSHAVAVVRPGPRLYPEASDERCTTALLLDIDPVGLVRGRRPGPSLEPYVNDRPYVASSFLSSAIAEHFGTAMGDRSKERQALADRALPLEAGSGAGTIWIKRSDQILTAFALREVTARLVAGRPGSTGRLDQLGPIVRASPFDSGRRRRCRRRCRRDRRRRGCG
jgi:RNA repair, ligase-Pnkp-associating, region of Hen1